MADARHPAKRSRGAIVGTTVGLNGDRIDDIVFSGLVANDGPFGGNFLSVKFSARQRLPSAAADR